MPAAFGGGWLAAYLRQPEGEAVLDQARQEGDGKGFAGWKQPQVGGQDRGPPVRQNAEEPTPGVVPEHADQADLPCKTSWKMRTKGTQPARLPTATPRRTLARAGSPSRLTPPGSSPEGTRPAGLAQEDGVRATRLFQGVDHHREPAASPRRAGSLG
jgi:hypothetical protein